AWVTSDRRRRTRLRRRRSRSAHSHHQVDRARHALPASLLFRELTAARGGERGVSCAAGVFPGLPRRADEAPPLAPGERGIERALIELEHVLRPLLEALGDPPAVHGLEAQCLEHHHVERSLEDLAALSRVAAVVLRHLGYSF